MSRSLANLACLAIAGALLASCNSAGVDEGGRLPPGSRDPERNLAWLERFADRVLVESLDASWQRSLGGTPREARFGRRPLLDLKPEELQALRARLETPAQRARLAAVERLSLLLRHDAAEGVDEARAALDAARAGLELDAPSLHRVLVESPDRDERRRAWMRLHAGSAELVPLFQDLQRARARWARREGFTDALAAFRSVDGVEERTRRRLSEELRHALRARPDSALTPPWDLETTDPALAARLAGRLTPGTLREQAEVLLAALGCEQVEWREGSDAQGFSAHATWAVDPPVDVRVLVGEEGGMAGAWRVLHELGHAAQAGRAPPATAPLLQRTRSPAVAEGAAKLLERLAFAPEWLGRLGVGASDLEAVADWEARSERGRARRILGDAAFEELLHEAPDGALDGMHRASWAELGLLSPHERSAWATERSLSHAPGERLAYLLGRCAQAAVYRRLRARPGGLLGEESLRLLREEILPAAAGSSYEEWFVAAAGEAPSCRAWLEDVARLPRAP